MMIIWKPTPCQIDMIMIEGSAIVSLQPVGLQRAEGDEAEEPLSSPRSGL
jgi:hypothetical protein